MSCVVNRLKKKKCGIDLIAFHYVMAVICLVILHVVYLRGLRIET